MIAARQCGLAGVVAALVLAAGACESGSSAAEADAFVERAIVDACESLVASYAIYRDRPDPAAYAATFAEDGELVLPFGTFRGREALERRLAESAGKTVSRHFMSTTEIRVIDARNASGISYAMIFVEPASPDGPPPTSGPFAIGEYHDTFRLTDEGWKFARREFVPAFEWQESRQ